MVTGGKNRIKQQSGLVSFYQNWLFNFSWRLSYFSREFINDVVGVPINIRRENKRNSLSIMKIRLYVFNMTWSCHICTEMTKYNMDFSCIIYIFKSQTIEKLGIYWKDNKTHTESPGILEITLGKQLESKTMRSTHCHCLWKLGVLACSVDADVQKQGVTMCTVASGNLILLPPTPSSKLSLQCAHFFVLLTPNSRSKCVSKC